MERTAKELLAKGSNTNLFDTVKTLAGELYHNVVECPYDGSNFTRLGIPGDAYLKNLLEKSEMMYQIAVELKRRKENDIVIEDDLYDDITECRKVHEIVIEKPKSDEDGKIEMV